MKRQVGTVKWFSGPKGFGFIQPDDSVVEVFVHQTQIDMDGYRSLEEGDRVTFEVVDNGRGPAAKEVRRRE